MTRTNDAPSLEPLSGEQAAQMVRRLEERLSASAEAERAARARQARGEASPRDEADVREQLALARLLLAAGKFSLAECSFYCLFHVERIHDGRWLAGLYDAELAPIAAAMDEIQRAHGLEEDEVFPLDSAPPEWLELNERYDSVLDDKRDAVLDEFGLVELLALRREDREAFDALRETGRLAFFQKSDAEANMLNLIRIYERETRQAAMAGAWFAAVSMLACAAEARLVLQCLRRPDAVRSATDRLSRKTGLRSDDPLGWRTEQLVAVAHAGGWLHNLPDEQLVTAVAEWLDRLPARHPGRQVLVGLQPALGEEEFETARSAYRALRASLDHAARAAEAGATLQ